MKKLAVWGALAGMLALHLAVIALLSGCGTVVEKKAGDWLMVARTNVVTVTKDLPSRPVVTTNETGRGDGWVQVVTNFVPVIERVAVTNVVYEARPGVSGALETGQVVSGFLPPPYGQIVGLGLGALSAGLGYLARRKNQERIEATELLETVVQGVEKAGQLFPDGHKVKAAIKNVADANGVGGRLHRVVKRVTG